MSHFNELDESPPNADAKGVKNFNPAWNQLGLYIIPSEGHYLSYFLKRSWGNYLFFPHPDVDRMFPFILASGGIYKLFDANLPFPETNKRLFDKFGAPTIGTGRDYHVDFLVESVPEDYFDVDLSVSPQKFELTIKHEVFSFLDAGAEAPFKGHPLHRLK